MAENANFDLADQHIVTTNFLLLHQAQSAELFQMMIGDAWTAETKGALDFSDAGRFAIF